MLTAGYERMPPTRYGTLPTVIPVRMRHSRPHYRTRLSGGAFFALAVYILGQEAVTFLAGIRPSTSLGGIGWLAATLLAMLLLAWGKGVTGRRLGNAVLRATS